MEGFVELAELGERFELDARDLGPYIERAARRLEERGYDDSAATLDEIRSQLVERTAEAQTASDADDAVLLDAARLEPRFISES